MGVMEFDDESERSQFNEDMYGPHFHAGPVWLFSRILNFTKKISLRPWKKVRKNRG